MKSHFLESLRGVFYGAVFAVAFVTICTFIHRRLPLPDVPIVWQKLAHLSQRVDDYDTLFVGSSRIHYQIIPRLFDARAAELGVPTTSFNAGVAGMRPPEDAFFLDQILAHRPAKLRWVFIELAGIRPSIGEERRGTMRVQYWHDGPRLATLWRHALQLKPTKKRWTPKRWWREVRDPLTEFFPHLELFVREQINIGKGEFLTKRLIDGPPKPRGSLTNALGPDLGGWIPTGRGEEMIPVNREAFERELAERRAKPATKDFGDPISQEALEEMIAKVEQAGATAVLIVPPTTSKKNFFPTPERERKTMVIDFSDLEKSPALDQNRHRLDAEHTNTAGSEILTQLLVERWAEAVKAKR